MTGVKVALWYCHIQDDLPDTVTRLLPRVKEIHMEVKYEESYTHCQCIHSVFSPQATVFPSGIKMQLVEEIQTLTNQVACSTESQLCALQATFLAHSKTGLLCILPHLSYRKDKTCSSSSQLSLTQQQSPIKNHSMK